MFVDIDKIKKSLEEKIRDSLKALPARPKLAVVSTVKDSAVDLYLQSQQKSADNLGLGYELFNCQKDSVRQAEGVVKELARDKSVCGIMLCRPLAEGLDLGRLIENIPALKDVEGITFENMGRLFLGIPRVVSPVALACLEIIKAAGIDLYGKEAVVIGHSNTVGKPVAALLLNAMATVSICHIATSECRHLRSYVEKADVLVVSAGVPELVKGGWVKENSIIIDVGINKVGNKIVGDVEFLQAKERAAFVSPVPKGVGRLTIPFLFLNLIELFKLQNGI